MNCFAKLDLKGSYQEIKMCSEAREYSMINIYEHLVLFRWTCLPLGIKTSSIMFQTAIEHVGNDIDVCLGAKTGESLRNKGR